ncbi:hypothetical protein GLOIN_2v1870949 [Rhizophagus clarus]|uniref:BTB domain-containing protein n=1 Tax=Rhizophagus clarus TaxID=94130 RepID=A0A8H3R4H4_9GLOM|nr:hypothetical protein GLOIN_2v1870949 [Rhizophagus clarus]
MMQMTIMLLLNALSAYWITEKDDMIMFSKPNLTPTIFDMILKYIYTGELDLSHLTKQSGENILGLLVASDELLLEELFNYAQDYLIKTLQDYCLESICENPLPFFSSKTFPSINKEILIGFLKRDDLEIEEIINYKALKKTLDQFIPFIRFVGISREEFFDKTHPYKIIIPKHIYKEIEKFYYKDSLLKTTILPPRIGFTGMGKFDSSIIKSKLVKRIINWIDKKDTMYIRTRNDPLYKLNLIYRGSQDGISNRSFREKCISLGEDYIVEDGFRFYSSSDNFIFPFEDSEDTQNMKISRVVNKNMAILSSDNGGFNFGWGSLCMSDKRLSLNNNSNSYEKI